jgi:hypothetical protein
MLSDQDTQQWTKFRVREQLLTLEETAEYLRLTPGALYTQRYRREKPGVLGIRVGRRVLFRPSDIDRFLDERLSEVEVDEDR